MRNAAGALHVNSNLIPPPLPLHTLFKTKELKSNESLITPSDNSAYISSWISFLTCETPNMYKDSHKVNMSYLDTAGHMNAINVDNPNGRACAAAVNNANCDLVDYVDCAGFNEGGGEVYIPSAFKLDLRLTKANQTTVCMEADHANIPIADTRLLLKDLKITISIFKPKDQLTALNEMFVDLDKDRKYYTTVST